MIFEENKWLEATKAGHEVARALELERIKSVRLSGGVLIYNPENKTEYIEMAYPEEYRFSN